MQVMLARSKSQAAPSYPRNSNNTSSSSKTSSSNSSHPASITIATATSVDNSTSTSSHSKTTSETLSQSLPGSDLPTSTHTAGPETTSTAEAVAKGDCEDSNLDASNQAAKLVPPANPNQALPKGGRASRRDVAKKVLTSMNANVQQAPAHHPYL